MNLPAARGAQTVLVDRSEGPEHAHKLIAGASDHACFAVDSNLALPDELPSWLCETFGAASREGCSLHAAIVSLRAHTDASGSIRAIGDRLLTGRPILGSPMTVRTTNGWQKLTITAEPSIGRSGTFCGYNVIIDRVSGHRWPDAEEARQNFMKNGLESVRSYMEGLGGHTAVFCVILTDCQTHLLAKTLEVVDSLFWLGGSSVVCDNCVLCVISNYSHPERLGEACENLCAALERFIPTKKRFVGAATTRTAGTSLLNLIEQAQSSADGAHQAGRDFMIYEPSIPAVASIDVLAGSFEAQIATGILEIGQQRGCTSEPCTTTWVDAQYGRVPNNITQNLIS